ncbi:uncharacterized protein [Musca autumnalis]|uniref:uncharacterized protein n=1 Tax=Musca autumnalis TaxID=221902 RepID=UPI003CF3128C
MTSFVTVFAFLAVCLVMAAAALPHKQQNVGHGGQATSYAVVTKHDDNKHTAHVEHHGYTHQVAEHYANKDDHHSLDDHHGHGDEHSYPKYEFAYGVEDLKTGDIKDQWESRDGDKVEGSYSLKESDGATRLVTYTSDKKNGFEATVHKIGEANEGHKLADHGY